MYHQVSPKTPYPSPSLSALPDRLSVIELQKTAPLRAAGPGYEPREDDDRNRLAWSIPTADKPGNDGSVRTATSSDAWSRAPGVAKL